MDHRGYAIGPFDDDSGYRIVLWRPGAEEESVEPHHAEHGHRGCDQRVVGRFRV